MATEFDFTDVLLYWSMVKVLIVMNFQSVNFLFVTKSMNKGWGLSTLNEFILNWNRNLIATRTFTVHVHECNDFSRNWMCYIKPLKLALGLWCDLAAS